MSLDLKCQQFALGEEPANYEVLDLVDLHFEGPGPLHAAK